MWGKDKSLVITDLDKKDSGTYICLRDNEYEAVHILQVVDDEPSVPV